MRAVILTDCPPLTPPPPPPKQAAARCQTSTRASCPFWPNRPPPSPETRRTRPPCAWSPTPGERPRHRFFVRHCQVTEMNDLSVFTNFTIVEWKVYEWQQELNVVGVAVLPPTGRSLIFHWCSFQLVSCCHKSRILVGLFVLFNEHLSWCFLNGGHFRAFFNVVGV